MALPNIIKYSWLLLCLLTLAFAPVSLQAQEEEEEEEVEQIRSRASLSCVQKDEGLIDLKMLMRAKIDGRYTGLPGLEVAFLTATDSTEIDLGTATTDEKGFATLTVNAAEIPRDTAGRMLFLAEFKGTGQFKKSDDDIEILPAQIVLEPEKGDSTLTMKMVLLQGEEPVVDEDIALFVKSLFSPLKIGEGTTDEDGLATIDFPTDLPGDTAGKLEIFARLDDHNDFGTVEAYTAQDWGIPAAEYSETLPRALWSPNPPTWMLLTFIVLMTAVWGHYAVIVYKLVQVNKTRGTS